MPKHLLLLLLILLFSETDLLAQLKYEEAKEAQGLQVGEKVKDFTATGLKNTVFILSNALEKGPVVLIFYRGQWCPVCRKHLSQLQDSLQLIYDKGASVIAVSPEKTEFLSLTAEKTKATFTLLFDKDYQISNAFDVTFLPDSKTRAMYNTMLGAKLKEAHSDDSQRLPIPATFIIGQDSKIVWRHFDPDYKKRAKVAEIVKHIPY